MSAKPERMLSLSLDVFLLAPLGSTEAELVNGLCAKLRTLAADPVRVREEMRAQLVPSDLCAAASPPPADAPEAEQGHRADDTSHEPGRPESCDQVCALVSPPAGAGLSGLCGGTYGPEPVPQAGECQAEAQPEGAGREAAMAA